MVASGLSPCGKRQVTDLAWDPAPWLSDSCSAAAVPWLEGGVLDRDPRGQQARLLDPLLLVSLHYTPGARLISSALFGEVSVQKLRGIFASCQRPANMTQEVRGPVPLDSETDFPKLNSSEGDVLLTSLPCFSNFSHVRPCGPGPRLCIMPLKTRCKLFILAVFI